MLTDEEIGPWANNWTRYMNVASFLVTVILLCET